MNEGILIFNEAEDFLQFMDQVQQEYNKTEEGVVND